MNTYERSILKTPVGLNTGKQPRIPSTKRASTTMTASSTTTEKPRATKASKGCRTCDWRDVKVSTKWLWNRLQGLPLKRS